MTPYNNLKKLIDDMINLANPDTNKADYDKWVKDVKQFLKDQYGENSKKFAEFVASSKVMDVYFLNYASFQPEQLLSRLVDCKEILESVLSELATGFQNN